MDWSAILLDSTQVMTAYALLIGRLFIGVCFVVHGLGKLGLVGGGDMAGFVAWLEELGVPRAPLQARMAMLSEITGGHWGCSRDRLACCSASPCSWRAASVTAALAT